MINIDEETLRQIIRSDIELRLPKISNIIWDGVYPGTDVTGDQLIDVIDKVENELMKNLIDDIMARIRSY